MNETNMSGVGAFGRMKTLLKSNPLLYRVSLSAYNPIAHCLRGISTALDAAYRVRKAKDRVRIFARTLLEVPPFKAARPAVTRLADGARSLGMLLGDSWAFLPALRGAPRVRAVPIAMASSPLVVMLVISELWIDPRVQRAAQTLARAGFRVRIVYPDFFSERRGIGPLDWGPGIEFRPLPGAYSWFSNNFPWLIGNDYLTAVLEERPFAIHAHDLNTALIGLAAAGRLGCYCLCDFHEWYSENVSWDVAKQSYVPHRRAKKLAYWATELLAMHRATGIITVCDSIARELRSWRYLSRRRVHVIRNIPQVSRHEDAPWPDIRTEIGVGTECFVLLWQGGVGPTRLIEPLIDAMAFAPNVVFAIRGPVIERFQDEYLARAERCGAGGRVFCLPPVPADRVVDAAVSADAGIWSLPNLSKNFYYALPNKIFEYLAAGLPVLGAAFPEARALIEGYDVGLCFDPYDPRSVGQQLRRLTDEPGLRARFRANIPRALADLQADREWNKLLGIYEAMAAGRAP